MQEFESSFGGLNGKGRAVRGKKVGHYGWEYAPLPPRRQAVVSWCAEQDAEAERCKYYCDVYMGQSSSASPPRRVCHFAARSTYPEEQVRFQVFAKEEIERDGT
jgi:hypothetical protein